MTYDDIASLMHERNLICEDILRTSNPEHLRELIAEVARINEVIGRFYGKS